MRERYVVLPVHAIAGAGGFDDPAKAGAAASRLVQKDRVPRVVVAVHAEVRVTEAVDIVTIAEVDRAA